MEIFQLLIISHLNTKLCSIHESINKCKSFRKNKVIHDVINNIYIRFSSNTKEAHNQKL